MHTRDVFLFAIAVLALSGCATLRGLEAGKTEQLLAGAGFQRRAVDTSERLGDRATMPPFKIVARNNDGNVVYTFADPEKCHCLYVGGSKEYTAYQRLVTERQIAQERIWAEEDAMSWGLWGPWYWR